MLNSCDWIAYVGPFPFPWGQAASRRMCGVARTLANAGFKVVVGSGAATPINPVDLGEGEEVHSIQYVGLGESPKAGSSVLNKSFQVFYSWGSKTVSWLDSQLVKPSHVVVYGGSAQYMIRLLPWCKKHGIPLIVDVVEWYDPRQMTGGTFGPFNLSAKFALRFLYAKCDGVIAISKLLQDYYETKGCPSIRIPPTLDVGALRFEAPVDLQDHHQLLTLVYAGTPGKKDLLGNVIQAVSRLDPAGQRLRLLVIGPNYQDVCSLAGDSVLPPVVHVLGRLEQWQVAEHVRSADFSVLLREPLRFANAGFPTKFVESLSNGTPVIANLTSDIGLYLQDGVEGFVCADHSIESLQSALARALFLSRSELLAMRNAAREQAERSFDFRVFTNSVRVFFDRVAA